jgi:hypothetical protein
VRRVVGGRPGRPVAAPRGAVRGAGARAAALVQESRQPVEGGGAPTAPGGGEAAPRGRRVVGLLGGGRSPGCRRPRREEKVGRGGGRAPAHGRLRVRGAEPLRHYTQERKSSEW